MAAKETSNYDYLQEVMVNTFNSWEEICSSFKKNVNNLTFILLVHACTVSQQLHKLLELVCCILVPVDVAI